MAENTDAPSWVTLTEDEQLVWSGHPSMWSNGRWVVAGIVLIGIGIGIFLGVSRIASVSDLLRLLSIIPVVGGLLLIVVPIFIKRLKVQYVITSEEVYKKKGLFSRDVTNLRLDSVQNTSYSQSFLERLLMYGTVHIELASAGESDFVFDDVPDPERVIALITQHIDAISPQPQDQRTQ